MITLMVYTHDGQIYQTQVNEYDPATLNDQINNNEFFTVAIGNLILARISIKAVVPADESL